MVQQADTRRRRAPSLPPEERMEGILRAAADVFTEKGFAAARIEDVAVRAGIAKGTVYLHFASKEALFKALIETTVAPSVGHMEDLLHDERIASADLLRRVLGVVRGEILGTDRRRIVRLVISEGHRFPDVARVYHDQVIRRAMDLVRKIVERGIARGEFDRDELLRFPQLFAAPLLVALVWEGLFEPREPLDADAMLDAHLDLVLRGLGAGT
jgi:AcrR family transcriptional regulator